MIPIKLNLRNFMCYRDNVPSINFESIHTACISGNNGNGKSALIDAITWALWGQTRSSSDDDLIHSGQNEVEVEFEFAVGSQQYRILRKHSKPKTQKSSGQTILEFQIRTPDGLKVLSGDTTTQTQQKIVQLLRMDYDTFINSAFLRQGRSDEFTKKRPAERKQVLGNILQLSIYDQLEELAKNQVKDQANLITQIETTLNSLQDELIHKPTYQEDLMKAQSELTQAEKLTQDHEVILNNLRSEKQNLENKKAQMEEIRARLQTSEDNCNSWADQAQRCRIRIQDYENLIAQRETIINNYNQLIETRKLSQELDQKFKLFNSLTLSKHRLEMTILKAGEDLNRSHAVSENSIRELDAVSQKLPELQEGMKQTQGQLRTLGESETRLQERKAHLGLLQARAHFLQAEKIRLLQEIEQVEEKLKMLSHPDGMTCPLCESELGPDGQKRIETKYLTEKVAKNEALKNNQSELVNKENEARELETEILQNESKLKRAREIAQSKFGTLSQTIADAQKAGEKAEIVKKTLLEIEEKLARRDFAVNEQNALVEIEKQITGIGYNREQHDLLHSHLTSLEPFEQPQRQLEEAEKLILQEKENETRACRTAEELRLKLEEDKGRIRSLTDDLDRFSRITGDLAQAEIKYQSLLSEQKRIQEVLGRIKANLERLEELETRRQEKENQMAAANKQEKIYKDLAQAFGKKGIQAMLIELAIPEIEAEANKLLARMTDNRMHIKMETQRETKKGDVLETLDINISDELGTRNYEMFSGGESFRIDFAIRIALSKLLARRAGAPLPTLIIDEGFGTQDNIGIEKIKEAITSIQDDFEKILVITHIADFKDAFPLRIEVVKTPEGSSISLN